jgi:L-fucose isomerase-like protein
VETGRKRLLKAIEEAGYEYRIIPSDKGTSGGVETREDAKLCAEYLQAHAEEIDGIIVSLPNFGEEKTVGETLKMAALDKPVLLHAFPDRLDKMDVNNRADAFCGKFSAANVLHQNGIPFSNTQLHVEEPESEQFKEDLHWFAGVSRVVGGVKNARLGQVGIRVAPFNTVRYSEKLLQHHGITVEPIGVLDLIKRAEGFDKNDELLTQYRKSLKEYIDTSSAPEEAIEKIVRLSAALDEWIQENELDGIAFQCWDAIERYYGVAPCTSMSLLSQMLIPAACEVDIMGSLSMLALSLASGSPSALLDINNNYGNNTDKAVMFHCSNLPGCFFKSKKMNYLDLLSREVNYDLTYGSIEGKIDVGDATLLRISSNDTEGKLRAYMAEGNFTDDAVESFGGYGVLQVKKMQGLLDYIVNSGFEHHVAVTRAHIGRVIGEAMSKYLGWELYFHNVE